MARVSMRLDVTYHPAAQCEHEGCSFVLDSGADTRDRAKHHVRATGHEVMVVSTRHTRYQRED